MTLLTMDVLLNNFVLVRQILAMPGAVVMIMSKVKMNWPYQALGSLKVRTLNHLIIQILQILVPMVRFGVIGVNGATVIMLQEQKSDTGNVWQGIHTAKANWKANR